MSHRFRFASNPGEAPGGEHSIQPERSAESVQEREGREESERLRRIEQDSGLLMRLGLAGFDGPEWNQFVEALVAYGMAVLVPWIITGRIFRQCERKGCRLQTRDVGRLDAMELAGETVAFSLVYFREKVLKPREWDPGRGTQLKTFFIGACVLHFPNIYRRWLRQSLECVRIGLEGHDARNVLDFQLLPDEHVELLLALPELEPGIREILQLTVAGFSQCEIAETLGTTEKAVELRLARFRASRGIVPPRSRSRP